ncbi:MAG TPA: sodium:proton antiporter, partial [Spirochaetia bacterium]|nr:sodium:proton antiporter [Spirochaetia bacterium]
MKTAHEIKSGTQIITRTASLLAAATLLVLIHIAPVPAPFHIGGETAELSIKAKDSLAILAFAVTAWMTGAVPFVITALATILLIPALHIADFTDTVASSFGDPLFLFFIGVMLISTAFGTSGLSARFSRVLLRLAGGNPGKIILAFLCIGAFCAMWFTEVAAAALLTPLAVEILRRSGCKPMSSNFGKSLMIACAWGPLIGGMGTPVGSGSNVLAISLLEKYAGVHIGFLQWMAFGIPSILLLLPIAWIIITRSFPCELTGLDVLSQETKAGRFDKREMITLMIFTGMVTLWLIAPFLKKITGGTVNLSMHIVAIGGALLLFLPGFEVCDWKIAEKSIDWGGIILIISGLAIGKIAFETGAAKWLAWIIAYILHLGAMPGWLLAVFAVFIVGIIHLCFSSNTVTGAVMVPLMIALAAVL